MTVKSAGETAYEACRQSVDYEPDYFPPAWIDLPEPVRRAWDLAQLALDSHMEYGIVPDPLGDLRAMNADLRKDVLEAEARISELETVPTDAELVARCNELAGVIRRALGSDIPEGYEFHLHLDKPRVKHGWDMAALVLEHLEGHDMAAALASVLGHSVSDGGDVPF